MCAFAKYSFHGISNEIEVRQLELELDFLHQKNDKDLT